jgi:hypothetical protein
LHFSAFGPRRFNGTAFEDNANSLLDVSDLVFVDPIGTGFSRAVTPDDANHFYGTLEDFVSVAQFIQIWLQANHAEKAPLFLIGESFGVWRAAAVADLLEEQGKPVNGIVLISGGSGVGEGLQPRNIATALRIPNRAAAALTLGKLSPDLGTDRDTIVKQATAWATNTYAPALARVDTLSDAERDTIISGIARYTAFPAAQIDRKTLTVTPRQYLKGLLAADGKTLNTFDMRKLAGGGGGNDAAFDAYFRTELGYKTDLAYAGLSINPTHDATVPPPGSINENWNYDSGPITPEVMAAAMAGEGPPGSQPWALNAVKRDPNLQVMVAAGLYDSLNSCAGNNDLLPRIPASQNFTMKCYLGGHAMYLDAGAHVALTADVRAFIRANSGAPNR